MRFGKYECAAVILDSFLLDGGAMFGVVPKPLWEQKITADGANRIPMKARSLIISGNGRVIIVDTGIGDKISEKFKSIYAIEPVETFLQLYEDEHGPLPVPLLLGLLPLYNARHASFLHHEVPGVFIPDAIRQRMEEAAENGPRAGVQIAIELTMALRQRVQGIYLMPAFSRYDLIAEIIEAVNRP